MKKVFAIIMALICCGNLVTEVGAMNLNIIEKENNINDLKNKIHDIRGDFLNKNIQKVLTIY